MIEVENLSKYYGSLAAVRDVSFRVGAGQVVGFLGPNGAGKSTTLRVLAGFVGASSGRVRIGGYDIESERLDALGVIGYMPETAPLYVEMRVTEQLRFRAELKGVGRTEGRKAIAKEVSRVIERATITDVADVPIDELSKGYRQRVALADALLGSPPLLILDEPSAGLDPNQIREVRSLIRELGGEQTVLLSSHILPEIEATCSEVLVIDQGRLVAKGTIDDIRREQAPAAVRLVLSGDVETALVAIEEHEVVENCRVDEGPHTQLVVHLKSEVVIDVGGATAKLVACCVGAGALVREASPEAPSLEDVFSRLTRSENERREDAP